ncbi:Mitogen-activated protein kinase kinase kinase 5 [Geodia barretti]|uniref:Mitogen-activated protein kinase kinase kinase 5 n=1 Tax=Geodia barretti TaxID=519541 RepID=A0AA35RKQ2_GEOBA|nr:Mitogen-activated protein kinase kinase kinase 5 [Geodia barretti]
MENVPGGTLQFMAPEVIQSGLRGYGPPADIWSLGCTVVEMATGKPPFYELGDPMAALFVVGNFKRHPDVPETMSAAAKCFCEKCFHKDPKLRITAGELLWHKFLSSAPAKRPSIDATSTLDAKLSKSLTLKIGQQGKPATDLRRLKSTPVHSPEPNNDSDADEPDTPGLDYVLGEGGEEGGEGEGGTHPKQFNQVMLQAQNRMICEEVLTKLKESRPPRVDKGQLLVVISALALFARSDSDTGLEDILGQLKRDCFHDHHLRDDVELSCKTLIPAAVTMANKRHGTAPHAMFAIDEIVLCGVQSVQSILEKIPPTPTKSPSHTSLTVTTPVTTPTSSVDARDVQRQLRTALEENLQ